MRLGSFLLSILLSSAIISCQKGMEVPKNEENSDSRVRMLAATNSFSYSNVIFYVGKTKRENLISPIAKPNAPGKFVAIPAGLSLDAATGTIDLSNSDAGQAYKIFFVDRDGNLADSTRIVISGVDYADGIYNLKNSRANNGRLKAKYNANASLDVPVSVINSFGEEGNGGQNRKLAINNITGEIDIAATVRGSAIGRANQNNEFIVRYRINDRSSRAQNKLKVKIYQFPSEEAVPQDIIDTIKEREEILRRVNAMPVGNTSGGYTDGGTESGLDAYAKPVRPPLIVVIN
jgi:hypothetical protein